MASITSWTRLEPRARTNDIALGLQARVHDPLWLLARQWQFGELTGEDAASPVQVRLRAEHAPINRYAPGTSAELSTFDPALPLEVLVEREPGPDPALNPVHAAETGVHFLRMLAAAGLGRLRGEVIGAYRLVVPPPGDGGEDGDAERTARLLAARSPDGHALKLALQSSAIPAGIAVEPHEEAGFREVAGAWLRWVEGLYSRAAHGSAWLEDRMEYGFRVAAEEPEGRVELAAPEYHGGRLDWYDFVEATERNAGFPSDATEIVRNVIPTLATYPGMPVDRWWEFEDARTDFGGVAAEPGDVARLLVAEYATVYGSDWYLVPVDVPVGSLCRVRSLVVRDSFGRETLVREADPADGFSLFRTSGEQDEHSGFLFLAPALHAELEGEPVEEVRFMRDEMANMAWAVERTVEGRTGLPVDRHAAWSARRGTAAAQHDAGGALVYRLASEVPEHWFALVPVESHGGMRLKLLDKTRRSDAGEPELVKPAGRVLQLRDGQLIQEEEVPREGVRVRRAWQLARGVDGATHAWVGRRKSPSGGEGSSGLLFDSVASEAVD